MNQHQQLFGFFNLSTDINQVVQKLDHNQPKKNLNEQQIQQIVTEQFQLEKKIIDAKNQEVMNQFMNQMQKKFDQMTDVFEKMNQMQKKFDQMTDVFEKMNQMQKEFDQMREMLEKMTLLFNLLNSSQMPFNQNKMLLLLQNPKQKEASNGFCPDYLSVKKNGTRNSLIDFDSKSTKSC